MKQDEYKVGDLVGLVSEDGSGNGTGEGIIWRVTGAKKLSDTWQELRVKPAWCATGWCSLRPKKVFNTNVLQRFDYLRLGQLRLQLDDLVREALALSAGVEPGEKETV